MNRNNSLYRTLISFIILKTISIKILTNRLYQCPSPGVPPSTGTHYRAHQLALWSWFVPELEAAAGGQIVPSTRNNNSWELSDDPSLFYGTIRPTAPWAFLDPNNLNKSGAVASGVAAPSTSAPGGPGDKTSHLTTTLALSPTRARYLNRLTKNNFENSNIVYYICVLDK